MSTTPLQQEKILDGARVAAEIRAEVAEEASSLAAAGIVPGLGVLLVGDDPASHVYVRNKSRACDEAGIRSWTVRLPQSATRAEVLAAIAELNSRDEVHAILVQLPLPPQVDSAAVLEAVDPRKDADGFHPESVGRLWSGRAALAPCTPAGILELLRRAAVPLEGAEAVVLGRSDIVGKPMAALLLAANATVTVCHSRTRDLPSVARRADVLVAAIGRPGFVTRDFVKPGAVVVDVGINRVTDNALATRLLGRSPERLAAFGRRGEVLVGDVDFEDVLPIAGRITPVPGGVGPLTIAMLLRNTVTAARRLAGAPEARTRQLAAIPAEGTP